MRALRAGTGTKRSARRAARARAKPRTKPAAGERFARRLGDALGLEDGRFAWRWIVLVATAALGIASLVLGVVGMAITLPLRYFGDALLHATYVQRMREAGWYVDNDRLGAPWGLDAADFPLGGENLHWLALKLIGAVAPTPWAAINVYYVLTYVLVAVAAFVVLRALRVRLSLAAAAALLFTFLPFHQFRGVSHLLRPATTSCRSWSW